MIYSTVCLLMTKPDVRTKWWKIEGPQKSMRQLEIHDKDMKDPIALPGLGFWG